MSLFDVDNPNVEELQKREEKRPLINRLAYAAVLTPFIVWICALIFVFCWQVYYK